jgi:hypothetical protein
VQRFVAIAVINMIVATKARKKSLALSSERRKDD